MTQIQSVEMDVVIPVSLKSDGHAQVLPIPLVFQFVEMHEK